MEYWQLKQRQALPLEAKIALSKKRVREWYDHWEGQVYVSFSGGKDSTVLLHLVRLMYPEVPAVFVNTGLEYPEIVKFVKTIDNVDILRPEKGFYKIIQEHGYPIISKEVSQKIWEVRTTKSNKLRKIRLEGYGNKYNSGRIPLKWQYLINSDIKISHKCCDYMKKKPMKDFKNIYIGNMASNSHLRKQMYLRNGGCNSYKGKQYSHPLSIWLELDIWDYIKQFNVPYSKIYDMGYNRTGCMFCMFGVHLEKEPNRFQRMKVTHPKLYKYCMETLGLEEVLKYIKVEYK